MIFDSLTGNENHKTSLLRLFREGRPPHAILLEGDHGSGRFTFARMISAAGVCRVTAGGCGACPDCKMALAGIHPDVEVYARTDAPGTLTIKSLREINRTVATPPVQGRRRVVILRDIQDAVQVRTLNTLLKVLEEPPDYLMFVITADSRDNLLPTIVSRCLTLRMQLPDAETCAARALKIAADGKTAVSGETKQSGEDLFGQAHRFAVLTNGNIGRTVSLLSDSPEAKAMTDALALSRQIAAGQRYDALCALRRYERDRAGYRALLSCLGDVFGRVLLERCTESVQTRLFEDLTRRLSPAQIVRILEIIGQTAGEARQNVNLTLALTRFGARLYSVAVTL